MASTIILSDNGVSSGSAGLKETGGNDGVLILQSTTAGGAATNAVYINTSQNVGLGISPAVKLDVVGTIWSRSGGTAGAVASLSSDATSGANGITLEASFVTGGYGPIKFKTGNAVYMVIESSGNVGIGASSPKAQQHILGSGQLTPALTDAGDRGGMLRVSGNSTNVGAGGAILFANAQADTANSVGFAAIKGLLADGSGNTSGSLAFSNRNAPSDIALTERMRIDTSGNLLVGTISPLSRLTVSGPSNANGTAYFASSSAFDVSNPAAIFSKYDNNTTTSQILVKFIVNNGNTAQGQINANGASAAAFGSWSDQRLKENIVELPSQLANIMALRPVEFDYIESEGGGHQIGFIAQEVQEIYPDLVGERSDGMLTLTDLNKNDARLIKAIQEQQALITTLTERITALEAK